MWLPPFGVLSSVVLGCSRLCLVVLLPCLNVGGPLAGQRVQQCGRWFLVASFDVCGGKRMIEVLRTMRGCWGILYLCSLKLCIFGRRRMSLPCLLVLVISLFALPLLVRNSFCILHAYLGALYAFYEIGFLLIKKKSFCFQ